MNDHSNSRVSQRGNAPNVEAVLSQLEVYGPCSPALVQRLRSLSSRVDRGVRGSILQAEGGPTVGPRYLLQGWACRLRDLADGRRLIFDFILPGEGINISARPYANTLTTIALTPVALADATPLFDSVDPAISREIAVLMESAANANERRLLDAVVRVGSMSADEGLSHLLLQLRARLASVGLISGDTFQLPLTQVDLANALGVSAVHLNRTIKLLHQRGFVNLTRGRVTIIDMKGLIDLAPIPVI